MRQTKKIQKDLNKVISSEFLASRSGGGNTKLTYIEGHTALALANKVFGYNGWSSKIKRIKMMYCTQNKDGKWSAGYTCSCKITLSDGTYREDVGFGSAENQRNQGVAIEGASKEAVTDSHKRTLRQFGNLLGLCCYDKSYLLAASKLPKKVGGAKFDNVYYKADLYADSDEDSFEVGDILTEQ